MLLSHIPGIQPLQNLGKKTVAQKAGRKCPFTPYESIIILYSDTEI